MDRNQALLDEVAWLLRGQPRKHLTVRATEWALHLRLPPRVSREAVPDATFLARPFTSTVTMPPQTMLPPNDAKPLQPIQSLPCSCPICSRWCDVATWCCRWTPPTSAASGCWTGAAPVGKNQKRGRAADCKAEGSAHPRPCHARAAAAPAVAAALLVPPHAQPLLPAHNAPLPSPPQESHRAGGHRRPAGAAGAVPHAGAALPVVRAGGAAAGAAGSGRGCAPVSPMDAQMHAVVTPVCGTVCWTQHTPPHTPLPVQGYCTLQMWRALSGPEGVQQFSAWICALALESSPERRAFSRHGRQQYVGRDAVAALHAVSPVGGANTCNGTRVGRRGCCPCSLRPCRALHAALALEVQAATASHAALHGCLPCSPAAAAGAADTEPGPASLPGPAAGQPFPLCCCNPHQQAIAVTGGRQPVQACALCQCPACTAQRAGWLVQQAHSTHSWAPPLWLHSPPAALCGGAAAHGP